MKVTDVLCAFGGSARDRDLRGRVSRRSLKRAVAAGEVVRVARGTYALPPTDRAIVLSRQLRGVRSHRSAARHWGFAMPPGPAGEDITVPAGAARINVPQDARLRYRDLAGDDIIDGVTSPLRTVIDCLRDLSLREALAVGDSALRSGRVAADELAARAASMRGPGSAIVRERLALLDARAENAFESACRAILLAAGITGFEPQVVIRHRRGWIGRVDLANRRLRIVIECDGFETHGERAAMVRDCVRHTTLVAAGWRSLRFTWQQVMFHPEWVLALIQDTMHQAGSTAA